MNPLDEKSTTAQHFADTLALRGALRLCVVPPGSREVFARCSQGYGQISAQAIVEMSILSNRSARRNAQNNSSAEYRRLSTETKTSYKTTEFIAYVAAVVGVLVASYVIMSEGDRGDYFRADEAWFYVVLLTIGYMVSRGLAKAGSREPFDEDSGTNGM